MSKITFNDILLFLLMIYVLIIIFNSRKNGQIIIV